MNATACNCGLRSCIKSDIGPCPIHGRPAFKARANAPRCTCDDRKAVKALTDPCPVHPGKEPWEVAFDKAYARRLAELEARRSALVAELQSRGIL